MTTEPKKDCLGVFAKHWTPGEVKTRLAASIGDEKAAETYRRFVETTLARLGQLPCDKVLAYSPLAQKSELAAVAEGWKHSFQGEGDLGDRMQRFFAEQFEAGYERVVLLGTDSPNVPLESIELAFKSLHKNDAVFGPTEDGGYYLLGMSRLLIRLIENIPWSTAEVWPTTQARLQESGVSFATVATWYDVDTKTDLERLRNHLRHSQEPELKELARDL